MQATGDAELLKLRTRTVLAHRLPYPDKREWSPPGIGPRHFYTRNFNIRRGKVRWIWLIELQMFTLILMSVLISVNAEFSLFPLINEAMIGESIYFDCTTTELNNDVNWLHYGVGAKHHEDICLHCLGITHPNYKHRIRVNTIDNAGKVTFRFIINSVQRKDAGRYICQEDGGIGESLSTQLVVLESDPVCNSNIDPDGVVGPNSCNIEPEILQMSCSVSYYGNVPPIIQWRKVGLVHPTKRNVSCRDTGDQLACNLTFNANPDLHGSSYICETSTAATTRRFCSVGVINIIRVDINISSTELINGTKETINCLANSNQPCSYRWKWVDGLHEEVVSNEAELTPSKPGWHKCEATCSIRNNHCTVVSGLVHVVEPEAEMKMIPIVHWIITISTAFTLVVLLIFIIARLRRVRRRNGTESRLSREIATREQRML